MEDNLNLVNKSQFHQIGTMMELEDLWLLRKAFELFYFDLILHFLLYFYNFIFEARRKTPMKIHWLLYYRLYLPHTISNKDHKKHNDSQKVVVHQNIKDIGHLLPLINSLDQTWYIILVLGHTNQKHILCKQSPIRKQDNLTDPDSKARHFGQCDIHFNKLYIYSDHRNLFPCNSEEKEYIADF